MEKWCDSLVIGWIAFLIVGFLSGSIQHLSSIWHFFGGWLGYTCVVGIPVVLIYHKFFSKEKKKTKEKESNETGSS